MKTRERIIEGALSLYNQYGYSNVSMQRLADDLSLSPGNLTYHFPRKEELMVAIYTLFQKEMNEVIPDAAVNKPDLLQIDEQIERFYDLQQRFLFFYLDLLEIERAYKVIAEKHYVHINRQITALHAALYYNQEIGLLKDNEDHNYLWFLAEQLWFTAVFWPRQLRVRGLEDNLTNLKNAIWHQIYPHLTAKGKSIVKQLKRETKRLFYTP